MKKLFLALLLLCWLVPCGAAQQESAASPDGASPTADTATPAAEHDSVVEEIVARVNNAIITRSQLRRNEAQIARDAKDQHLSADQLKKHEADALRDLIDQQLLIQKANELGISADAELIKRLDEIRKEMKVNSIDQLRKAAESQGINWEQFKQNTRDSILAQKVIGSEVGGHIQITQKDIERYFQAHKDKFSQPARVRLSEILIAANPGALPGDLSEPTSAEVAAAQAKANQIHQQLKGGADFAALARKDSNGPTAAQGGDLGYFKPHDLAVQLEAQTFDLKIGQFTQPIRTRQGYVILSVTDRIRGGLPPLDRVRGQIQDQIYSERIQPALRAYLTKLRNQAYIDVRPGYTDTGASSAQPTLVYASGSGPKTRQVRGAFGLGHKKTVLVEDTGNDDFADDTGGNSSQPAMNTLADETSGSSDTQSDQSADSGSVLNFGNGSGNPFDLSGHSSVLNQAKRQADAAQQAIDEASTPAAKSKATREAEAHEKQMLRFMSQREQKKYFEYKKHEAERQTSRERKEKLKKQELAQKRREEKAAEARRRKQASRERKQEEKQRELAQQQSQEEARNAKKHSTSGQQQADANQPSPKKKKFSWF